ncbi:MAG: hypothetical protein ACR2GK_11730 [Gemmatimonadaceae bacterium]
MVYDERFAPTYGAWRAVVPEVADKFLACGVLEGFFMNAGEPATLAVEPGLELPAIGQIKSIQ